MSIKSFVGRRSETRRILNEKVKVSDFMSDKLVTFHPEQFVVDAIQTLLHHNISGGPVVNDENELIGMLSEGDCLKEISDCRYHNYPMEKVKVKDHMIKKVQTIDGNMNILDAANVFLNSRHRRFPIVENGKLVGIISQRDVLRAAMELKARSW